MRAARLGFLALALGWLVLLLAAPVTALGAPASALAYAFGSLICHQRPERSFHLQGAQLPVCARCFGLYAGAAVGAVAGLAIVGLTACASRTTTLWRSPSGLRQAVRFLLLAAAVPTALTWSLEAAGVWPFSNIVRFAAALPLGAAVALTVNYVECARPRRTGPSPPRMPI